MARGFVEHARGERLIGTGRLILALLALLAVQLDPDVGTIPTRQLLPVAAAFVVYSILLVVLSWRAPAMAVRSVLVLHVADFVFFSLFVKLTHAAVSPFFIFFLFSLLTALLRFGMQGMLITSGFAIATYLLLAFADERIRSDPGFLVMRSTSLAVATFLLAYVGAYYERMREELTKLAAWPESTATGHEAAVREILEHARDLFDSPRAMLIWDDEDEPWSYAAEWRDGAFRFERLDPGVADDLLRPEIGDATLLERTDSGEAGYLMRGGRLERLRSSALTQRGVEFLQGESVLSASVTGQTAKGRLFLVDRPHLLVEDMAVAEIIARLTAARLDQVNSARQMRSAAVAEERLRVARDLHDGLLQSLTAASLQIEVIRRMIPAAEPAAERLRAVQDLIATDQRELRSLITQLRPQAQERRPRLDVRLIELADRFQQQWDLAVTMNVDPAAAELPDTLTAELYSLVNESVANAAKHGRPSRVDVVVGVAGETVRVIVTDDGAGFPFKGRFTLAELNRQRRGPVTLKERVSSLGGHLDLDSRDDGATVSMTIPR